MDALPVILDQIKKEDLARGNFLGMLHVLIGRRIAKEGKVLSVGQTWRDLALYLKKARWDIESVRELGLDPDALPPRDRERFWYSAIARAQVDSAKTKAAGDLFAAALRTKGYDVS